jgi:hypothetical protein
MQYFESTAARELFEFQVPFMSHVCLYGSTSFSIQNTESAVSQAYVKALKNVIDNGVLIFISIFFIWYSLKHFQTKMVYVASLNDQVVPLYSGLFTSVSHPLILRALYIDVDAYQCVSQTSPIRHSIY